MRAHADLDEATHSLNCGVERGVPRSDQMTALGRKRPLPPKKDSWGNIPTDSDYCRCSQRLFLLLVIFEKFIWNFSALEEVYLGR
jgi:hypothetical protein